MMNTKERRDTLKYWALEALVDLDGRASVLEVTKKVWENHGPEITGDFFFTWQYDLRWAGAQLRESGHLKEGKKSWTLGLTALDGLEESPEK